MRGLQASIFARNIGIISEREQDRLLSATVGVAGVGGVGGLLTERLIRLGIGHLKITDPGTFETSNLNRQFGCTCSSLGRKKVEVVVSQVKDINPEARIDWDDRGITSAESADAFAEGCELVIDEMDFGLYRESIFLQRAARRRGIHYMFTTAMAFGALIAIFDPQGCSLEEYNGLSVDSDLDNLEALSVSIDKVIPARPSYFRNAASDEMIQKILAGQAPGPTISIGVGLAALLAANETVNLLLNRRDVVVAPRYTYLDLLDRTFLVNALGQPISTIE